MKTNPKKLRLDTEELVVEAFATGDDAPQRGTVKGHDPSDGWDGTCDGTSCSGDYMCICPLTLPNTCAC
ncbi:MAG TPA: hypothetical protein VFS20_06810 [Longimicrobium sp.]|nr:hypothetical protein [Longimicrobium sp.]